MNIGIDIDNTLTNTSIVSNTLVKQDILYHGVNDYHDLNNENSYHMMILGMCLCLSDNYKVIYNREEGKGRCDLIIQAHDEKKTSFIIEFKYFKEDKKDFEKALDKLSNEAIQQIKDRRYDYDLKGKVIYIGLAHHGKDVMMKWEEKVYI